LNLRPLGYEPSELPNCSTPRRCPFTVGARLTRGKLHWPPRQAHPPTLSAPAGARRLPRHHGEREDHAPKAVPPGWDIHREYRTGHVDVGGRVSRCSSCWLYRLTISWGDAPYGVSSAALLASSAG
jgi:hypothetical protein